jgi:hypothetical protein
LAPGQKASARDAKNARETVTAGQIKFASRTNFLCSPL